MIRARLVAGRPAARSCAASSTASTARCIATERGAGHRVAHRAVGCPKQALRPEHQHQRHEQRREDLRQRRREEDRDDAVRQPDQQRRDDGAAQAAEPADDDHDEGQQQRVAAHQVMRLADRHDQHRRDRRQRRPEAEDPGIDPVDVDAEGGRGLAVPLRRAHHQPDPGARQQQPDPAEDHHRRGDHRELVAGIAEPRAAAAASRTARHRPRVGPVEAERRLLQDVAEADGRDDRRLGLIVEPPQHQPVGGHRHRRHHQRRQTSGRDEGQRRRPGQPAA